MAGKSGEELYHYKIVLIGDPKVGKTSLRRNFMGESFETDYLTTLMADFASHTLEMDDFVVNYQIWDLAGQPGLNNVRTKYYYGAFGAILVFDITNPNSFENLDNWITQLERSTMSDGVPLIIASNKMDLEDEIKIDFEEVETYIEKLKEDYDYEILLIKTSAKTGRNVEKAFKELATSIHSWKMDEAEQRKQGKN